MEIFFLSLVIIVGFVVLAFLINRKNSSPDLMEVVRMLQTGVREDRQTMLDLQRSIGEMSEIGRSMRDLDLLLKSPKMRGGIGEHILKELLCESLPKESFNLQYTFRSGERVDAAIKTSGGIIPVDSKFPMENFQKMVRAHTDLEKEVATRAFERDIKLHIDSISKKYILTDEGTTDYALMYIPSEAVYYEVVNSDNLFEYAGSKRVLPVSPTTFYAYLKAILMSFEGQKVEARAKEILAALQGIQRDYSKVWENLGTLQKHLTNATNMMVGVLTGFNSLGQKIKNTKNLENSE